MIKKLKKGFTLVELIVVIAIIAILSTVAVVGYTRVVDKANVSNDTQLVRNLNERMSLYEAETGYSTPETAHEAFVLTEDFGFIIEKLTPTSSGNDIVWDMDSNRFALIDAEDHTVVYSDPQVTLSTNPINLWKMYKTLPSESEYSIYLAGTTITGDISVGVGVDVGRNSNVNINYENTSGTGQNVVIRTNGGTLKIDAQNDSVHHYGEVAFLDIEAINTSSYHEFGYAPYAQIKTGRIVNEAGTIEMSDGSIVQSGVENVFIVAESEGSGETAGTFNEVIIEAAQGSFVPSLDRSDVNIVGAVLVVEVKTANSDDYVYLTKAGIIEQVIVTSEKNNTDTTTASATFGTDESLSDASSKAANEIANIVKRGENGRPLKEDGETEMSIEEVAAISSVDEITISEPKATFEDLAKSQGDDAVFAGGTGTKGNPYLITSEDLWFKFAQLCKEDSDYSETNGKYFKVTSDINVGKYESGTLNILYFAGNIDFNNHKLFGWKYEIITDDIGSYVGAFDQLSNATIQNLDFYTCVIEGHSCQFPITSESRGVCVLKNCNVYGNCDPVNWNNTGFFVVYPRGSSLTLENCNNYANLINSGYSSAFIGRILAADDCDIYFKNCNNYANIISTNNGASMLIANPSLPVNNNKGRTYNIHIENCNNYGVICGTEDYMNLVIPTNNLYPNPNYTLLKVNGTNINTGSPSQAERYNRIVQSIENSMSGTNVSKLTINSLSTTNGYFDCAEIANAAKYVLSFGFTPSNRNGARYGYNMTFDTVPKNIKVGSWIAKSELDVNATIDAHMGEGTEYYTSGDYYVYHDDQGTILDKVKVAYIVYDNDGNIIYLASYTYQD